MIKGPTSLIGISACFFFFISCIHTEKLFSENLYNGRILEVEITKFKLKGKKIKSLDATIKSVDGFTRTHYAISSECGCVSKTEATYEGHWKQFHYQLSRTAEFDTALNEQDKFVFKKLASLPNIELFCSRTMLETAKGFIILNK